LKFEVQKREGSNDTVIEVESAKAFPTAFHLRIQEALQYLAAKPAMWRVRLENEGDQLSLELASPWRKSPRTQFGPPIAPNSIDFHERGWDLFACYLAYVVAKTEVKLPIGIQWPTTCTTPARLRPIRWTRGQSVFALLWKRSPDWYCRKKIKNAAARVAAFQKRMRECLGTQTDSGLGPSHGGINRCNEQQAAAG
jgi:hypothetical protein